LPRLKNEIEKAATPKTTTTTMISDDWQVGQLVTVQARTWAGINQPGGIARIQSIQQQQPTSNSGILTAADGSGATAAVVAATTRTTVGVKYVLDGRQEAAVHVRYIAPHSFGRERGLRNRGLLLGRCQRCGSLRTDCGSCDLNFCWTASSARSKSPSAPQAKRVKAKTGTISGAALRLQDKNNDQEDNDDGDDDDDDSSIDLDQLVAEHANAYRRFKRKQAAVAALVGDNAVPNYIQQLKTQRKAVDNAEVKTGSSSAMRRKRRKASTCAATTNTTLQQKYRRRHRRRMDGVLADAVVAANDNDDTFEMVGEASNGCSSSSEGETLIQNDEAFAAMTTSNRLVGFVATQDVGDCDTTGSSEDDHNESSSSRSDHNMAVDRPMRCLATGASAAATEPPAVMKASCTSDDELYGYGDDDEKETFVQPEGTATRLPRDVQDQTKDISLEDLPSFVTTTLDRIQATLERDYTIQVLQMEEMSACTSIAEWYVYSPSMTVITMRYFFCPHDNSATGSACTTS
jgi:hypothetical protein